MSSSAKLTAMRAWVVALQAYSEACRPFQQRGAAAPGPDAAARLALLEAEVTAAHAHYDQLSWQPSTTISA